MTEDAPPGSILWYLRRGLPLPKEIQDEIRDKAPLFDVFEPGLGEPALGWVLDRLAPAERPASMERRRPLPADVNLFMFSSIQKAVRRFAEQASLNTVVEETIFNSHDATRIRRLREGGYLRLNDERVLLVDARVGRVAKRYALRVWDEQSGRWIDPGKGGLTPG